MGKRANTDVDVSSAVDESAEEPPEGESATDEAPEAKDEENTPTPRDSALLELLRLLKKKPSDSRKQQQAVNAILRAIVEEYSCSQRYNVLVLFDDRSSMVAQDADHLYTSISSFTDKRDILLILHSSGGNAEPAYLISKMCRTHSKNRFIAVVPRRAKSAATLVCCGADEIHMGSLSELGPIDPQIDGLPALGLKNAVEQIADFVRKYPRASEMFADYLKESLKLTHFGYYDRVVASAVQYAERLLKTHADSLPESPDSIAWRMVYNYKDHSFVIDKDEAEEIFGNSIVRGGTEEYDMGNDIYQTCSLIGYLFKQHDLSFAFTGSPFDGNCYIWDTP